MVVSIMCGKLSEQDKKDLSNLWSKLSPEMKELFDNSLDKFKEEVEKSG